MPYVAVCQRLRSGCGRNQNKTYVNIVNQLRAFEVTTSLADWLTANPGHPWNNTGFNEFVVEVTQQEYDDFINGNFPLFYGENNTLQNEPRWQQQNEGSGSVKSFGSFADPEDDQSVFTADVALVDDRFIVRIYDDDPVANPGTVNHLGIEEIDQDLVTTTQLRYLRLFTAADVASNTNAENQRTEIGGKLIDFDFGSSNTEDPGLSAGVATFSIGVDRAGQGDFPSNGRYRVLLPGDIEGTYLWKVFGKIIEVQVD